MRLFPWTGVGVASVVLAHAFAISAVSHCHYVVPPPNRQGWFYAELILALLLWPLVRWYARWVWDHFRESPFSRLGVSLALGLVVHLWWAGQFEDTLWLHRPPARAVLRPVAWVAEWLTISAAFAGLLALTIAVTPPEGERAPLRVAATPFVAFALFLAIANVFASWYVGRERTLYYWDYMVYWTRCADLAELMRTAPPAEVCDHFRHGTRSDDYGPLPATPPAAVMAILGDARLVYILAVVNLYLTALAVAVWLFVRRFVPSAGVVVPLLLVLLSPVAWVPLLRGYLDIGGAALAVLALLVYLSRPAGELPWTRVLLLAGLLAGMAIFRRWYSFFAVAFFLVAAADTGLAMIRGGWRRAAPIVLTGVWAFVLVLAIAFDWVRRAATTDYATDYVAYKSLDSLADRAWLVIDNCGPGTVALAGLSMLVLLTYRETRRAALVVGGMVPVMVLHFLRVQDFGLHHCYLLLPAFVLLPALALVRVLAGVPNWLRWPAIALTAAAGIAAMAVMFVPETKPFHGRLRPAVSRLYFPPLTRDDLPEFIRLLQATETEAAKTKGGRVAVVASSLIISQTMFTTADRSLQEPVFRRDRIAIAPEVDRVGGGFPEEFFRADVLVVPGSPQTHLRPDEQQVIVATTESLLNRTDIGKAFDRLPGEFHLADGVTVSLYRRARPIAPADFEAYHDKLQRAHPDLPHVYTPAAPVEELLRGPSGF